MYLLFIPLYTISEFKSENDKGMFSYDKVYLKFTSLDAVKMLDVINTLCRNSGKAIQNSFAAIKPLKYLIS